ncbi:SDR family oxidoreductase [bacterium]|nr:MAG: SDR family oxidoreductase [bacterium]
MDLGIGGKVAMVAAASKGIGLAVAQALAAEGVQISICGRNEETLEAAAALISPETRTYVVDVTQADDLEWWVNETTTDLGAPDILVTNTGGPPAGGLDSLSDEQWQSGVDSTLMNIVRLSRLVVPGMVERGWGRVVHITSLAAREPSPVLPISSTIRSGLVALTKLQGREYAAHGVTVNGVLPGNTLTDRQRHLAEIRAGKDGITMEEALARIGAETPIGRLADPREIADVVAFLCSVRASYVTGESVLVDGGMVRG